MFNYAAEQKTVAEMVAEYKAKGGKVTRVGSTVSEAARKRADLAKRHKESMAKLVTVYVSR